MQITRFGDVCVTPMSMNWNCKLADWVGQAKGYPNMCFLPEEINGPEAAFLYGDCIFDTHTAGSLALADEILTASKSKNSLRKAPRRNSFLSVWLRTIEVKIIYTGKPSFSVRANVSQCSIAGI